jgi:VWFA-related protein
VRIITILLQFVTGSRRTIPCLVLAATILSHPAWAQEPPVFRASVDLVTVDVSVVRANGLPDPNLRPDDFAVKVDGKPRRVVSAQFVRHVPTTGATPIGAASTHFTSNEDVSVGRYIVIAVDEAHIRRLEGRSALSAAATFLDTLDPLDNLAVVGLSRVGTIDFTRDRAALKRRLQSLVGHTDPVFLQFNLGLLEAVEIADGNRGRLADAVLRECGRSLSTFRSQARTDDDAISRDACPEQLEQEARGVAQHARTQARISLSALASLIDSLKVLDGPKTVVVMSEGMVLDPRLVDLGQLAASTRESRVTIYGLQMEVPIFEAAQERVSPTLVQDTQMRGDGLGRLAGAARGTVFRLVGSDPTPFRRIAAELSGYYLLAFEPLEADRDGRVHRIQVAVEGGGQIRAREAFQIPPTVRSARAREEDLVLLLRSARPATELPVRVATYTYVEPVSAQVRVVVSAEAETSSGAGAGMVLGYVLVDTRGVIVASGALRSETGRHAFTTRVDAGSYTLRVGSIDALGRRGLVERTFTATVRQQGGVQVSDLILAPVPAGPDVPLHPVIDRVAEANVVAYLEMAAQGAQPLTDVRVRFELIGENDTVRRPERAGDVVASGSLWASARTVIPLDGLPSGRYVVVARVQSGDRELARTARPFTIP